MNNLMSGAIMIDDELLEQFPELATMSDFRRGELVKKINDKKSSKGGETTKAKFGLDYYKEIRKKRGKTATKSL